LRQRKKVKSSNLPKDLMVFGFGKRKMAQDLRNVIREAARELPDISSPSFGAHFDQFGNSRLVLIGDGR